MARVWSLIKWATQVKSEGSQHAHERHSSQSKWPSARIADIDIDTRRLIYSGVFDRPPPCMVHDHIRCQAPAPHA